MSVNHNGSSAYDKAVTGFLNQTDTNARNQSLCYFEELKSSETGWQLSIEYLLARKDLDEAATFFYFQILGDFVKTRYQHADNTNQRIMRDFISQWIHIQSQSADSQPVVVRNKAAQVFCMVFLIDYPVRWPSFFKDLIQTFTLGASATDILLRLLLAINGEIADRDTPRTQREIQLFTSIKDTIRETCVKELVDCWHHILLTYQNQNPTLLCLCLKVIGSYIAWIHINLIANENFVSLFITFLSVPIVQESTCECIQEIINKGMDPVAKVKLVESFFLILEQAKSLDIKGEVDEDSDFVLNLASLVNVMGTTLLASWSKLLKLKDASGLSLATQAVQNKVGLLFKFLNNDDEEVSQAVIEFAREYLQFLKHQSQAGRYGPNDVANVEAMLYIVINKYKYDKSTNFHMLGHDEATFEMYRKSLKNLYDNLALLDIQAVFIHTKEIIMKMLQHWQNLPFEDIEVAITFLYFLSEIVPVVQAIGQPSTPAVEQRRNAVSEMACMLVTCGVSNHGHIAVTLQFFETVVRYEKFFAQQPKHIPEILMAFIDKRGLRHDSSHVRSRTSYLFSRFIKSLKTSIQDYTEEILRQLQDLLVLALPESMSSTGLVSTDDQLYLYETAAILIISGQFKPDQKKLLLLNLLSPIFEKFEILQQRLSVTTDECQRTAISKCMNHAIAVTSRTSKAFFTQQTMKLCGCTDVYVKALEVFMGALNLPNDQLLHSAVRQYLHRMVVCLEEEVLPFFPMAAEQLLKHSDIRSIQEFIPLINQIISKFKKKIVPFLHQIFMPFVEVIFMTLSTPVEESDSCMQSERQLLQRSYFLFISAIVTNNITEVIAALETQNLQQVLLTVIQGAVDFPDPVAQKTCFNILKKLVELWGGPDGVVGFVEFMYSNIVPACFMAPMKDTFDLNDAQTILALSETALCLKMVLSKRGDEFVTYLQAQYLPTLNISAELTQEYCQAIRSDNKAFKTYLKFFFQKART